MIERWLAWWLIGASVLHRGPERIELRRLGEEIRRAAAHPPLTTSR
ncbi:MAG TPA: hypothetical protein VGX00_07070 [Thermoplasmata archaeon]|nr:hypothetical protein [Thermoplasmata archaeon]